MTNTICPHCENTIGFAFGTCSRCGWNYLDHSFHFIRVWLSDVPDIDPRLIQKHADATRRDCEPFV